jgi:D-sedoheptulose 7-phosphate isomerase
LETILGDVERVAVLLERKLRGGGRVLIFGNGGSAADAQHFAAELLGRSRRDRRPFGAVALTTDSSALTSIANDYDFAEVFARQTTALAQPGDVVVGITTSGKSRNVLLGLAAGKARGATTVALTGIAGLSDDKAADYLVRVPSSTTARVQEMHVLIIHMLCERIDDWATSPS